MRRDCEHSHCEEQRRFSAKEHQSSHSAHIHKQREEETSVLSERPTPGGKGRQHHLCHTDSQHRAPQGCVFNPLLYSLIAIVGGNALKSNTLDYSDYFVVVKRNLTHSFFTLSNPLFSYFFK